MGILLVKLFRDIKKSIGGFISIIFVIGIGSAFFSGLLNSVNSVDNLIKKYYDSQNFMDYIGYFTEVNEQDVKSSSSTYNIEDMEFRYSFDTIYNINNKDTDLRIHTLTKNINKPYIYEGNLPKENEIVLDKTYMQFNDLKIGDKIKIKHKSLEFELQISGIIDSPEYVYKVKDIFTGNVNFSKFGAGYIDESTIINKFNENNIKFNYTEVLIKSNDDLDSSSIFKNIPTFLRIVGRKDHVSYSSFKGAVSQIQKVVVIFPLIFFLVAAIITFISMSKTVENQRTQIGIMGALGFSSFRIYFNFILYSLSGAIFGSLLGGILGIFTIPKIMLKTFSAQYVFPNEGLELYFSYILWGVLISVAFSVIATVISCYKTLKEVPANTLRPKAPKKSKHLLIERSPLWSKMSFTYKIIIRNIFHNKMRLFLSSTGVIGSIAFLITGFSLKASVDELLSYEKYIRAYDFEIRTLKYLENEEQVREYSDNIDLINLSSTIFGNFIEKDGNKNNIPIVVMKNGNTLFSIKNTNNRNVEFKEDTVVIPHDFLKKYGFNLGDKIKLEINIGNEIREIELTITDLGLMYSSQMIYVSESVLKNNGIDVLYNSAFVKLKDNSDINGLVSDLRKNQDIIGITMASDIQEYAKNIVRMINSIILIIAIGSAILSIAVIYNITSINIFERVREISTLLVLGYYDNEINKLIFIENIFLTIFGGIIGIPFGILLSKYMKQLISERGANLPDFISVPGIFWAFVLIILFSIITNMFLRRKVLKINMVESLKAVE